MRTELQRQTARLNGAKSRRPDGLPLWGTQPRTAAGKARCSQNARRHGLYSGRTLDELLGNGPAPLEPVQQFATRGEAAVHLAHRECMAIAALEARILSEEIERQASLHPGESRQDLLARLALPLG